MEIRDMFSHCCVINGVHVMVHLHHVHLTMFVEHVFSMFYSLYMYFIHVFMYVCMCVR